MNIRNLLLTLPLAASFALGACAKSPEDVCSHMEKLMAKETSADIAKKANEGCVKSMSRSKEMKGYFKYRKLSRCITSAEKLSDLKKCK
jgi:hypothetical protein